MHYVMIVITLLLGGISLAGFGFFLFKGPLHLVNLDLTELSILIFNSFLSLLFFIQHSTMIRGSFRKCACRFIPDYYCGSLYTLTSGITLIIVVIFWQQSSVRLIVPSTVIIYGTRFVFILAFLLMFRSMQVFRQSAALTLLGVVPILQHTGIQTYTSPLFTVRGPYRWSRHPIYAASILFFWAYPYLTPDRLLLNILWSLWIIVGATLEERDLIEKFGKPYENYQKHVPMIFPIRLKPYKVV